MSNPPLAVIRAVVALAAASVFLIAGACGGSDAREAATATPDGPTISPESPLTKAELATYLANANDFVRPLIEDGIVTAAEYEQATFRVIQCLDDAGLEHSQPVLDLDRRSPRWNYGVNFPSDAELARGGPIFEACERDFVLPVLEIYSRQEAPSAAEMQAIEQAVLTCLRDAGIEASSWVEVNTLVQEGLLSEGEMAERTRCMAEHYLGMEP